MENLGAREQLERELNLARQEIAALEGRLAREEEAKRSAETVRRFREAVIEHAAEGVCVCQDVAEFPFVKFSVWNHRMVEITGYQMEEINRLGWYQTLYPDPEVQNRARQRMERMRDGEDLRFERWEIECADGVKRPIAISTSVLVDEDGSVYVLGLMHDLSEKEALREETRRARTDELTTVRNRRGFEEEAGALIDFARRQHQAVTLGFIDVNGFKALNDSRGHREGDRALSAIGRELQASVRSLDVVGRLGGDEFALLLPGMTAQRAKGFFTELPNRLSILCQRSGWAIAFSVGVATYFGQVPALSAAIECADLLMYRAKATRTTRVVCEEISAPAQSAST